MSHSEKLLRLMESDLLLKKGALGSVSEFKPRVDNINVRAIGEGRWEGHWEEGEKRVRLSSSLNSRTNRYDLMLEVRATGQSKSFFYHRDFLSSEDARQEIQEMCEDAATGSGLRALGYLGPRWK
jgi:hypothetical protein